MFPTSDTLFFHSVSANNHPSPPPEVSALHFRGQGYPHQTFYNLALYASSTPLIPCTCVSKDISVVSTWWLNLLKLATFFIGKRDTMDNIVQDILCLRMNNRIVAAVRGLVDQG